MIRKILNRWNDAVLWEGEAATVKDAIHAAFAADADLRGADLRDADLTGADLSGADLSGADFRGADFRGADLRGADFRGADFRGADFRGADFRGADLRGADLSGADFRGAVGARAPIIPHIDAQILAAVKKEGNSLNMTGWHVCETTHCRAGWAIHLAGEAGYALEDRIGSAAAGALIYAASRPGQKVPNFYATTDEALADLVAGAKADPLPEATP